MRGRTLTAVGAATALAATAVVGISGAVAAKPKPPKTVKGTVFTRKGSIKPGTKVAGGGTRILIGAKAGWKMVSAKQGQYAAKTTDGGKTWRIASPALHINAADAPQAVSALGAMNAKVAYAYGGAQVADVTTNGGKTWYQTLWQGTVTLVGPAPFSNRLVAYVVGFSSSKQVLQYVSKNGGKTWNLKTGMP